MVDLADKLTCVKMLSEGTSAKEIYEHYYSGIYPESTYESFRRNLKKWQSKYASVADTSTLNQGTYPSFTAHAATVQINGSGEVVQAWIKQHQSEVNIEDLIEVIKEHTTPILVNSKVVNDSERMLEIPLYDMHFPLSEYKETLESLLDIVTSQKYEEINLVVGQDLLHNDDFRGRTSSGRPIEKFDMVQAWRLAEQFWYNLIYYSLLHAKKVNLIYSKGNHDETLAWAFVQRLAAMFPELCVDDSLAPRKCIHWKRCFIGITHGHMKKNSNPQGLRGQFTIDYPQEFADSVVREIHAGHLHHEEASDLYGVNVRRLSSAVPTDEWSDNEGYIGAHKRFMIFEWRPGKLHAIYYV